MKNIKLTLHNNLVISIFAVIAIIAIGIYFGWSNNLLVPLMPKPHFHYLLEPNNPLSFLSNWDGPNYLKIVNSGYSSVKLTNFFPLYPLVVYLVKQIIGFSTLDSGLMVSWISFIGAVYFYLKVIEEIFKTKLVEDKIKAISYFILFPTGVFLIATYTEPLFAFFMFSSLYLALRKRYLLSGLMTLFATATHITGVFLVVLLFLVLLEQKVSVIKSLVASFIGSLGIIGYMLYLEIKYHNPLEFIKTQHQIHGWLSYNLNSFIHTSDLFNYIFIVLLVISMKYWWIRRKSFAVFSFLFILIPIIGGQFGGFNRYVLMAFPVQFMLFDYFSKKSKFYPYVLALLGICWTYFLLEYAGGYIGG